MRCLSVVSFFLVGLFFVAAPSHAQTDFAEALNAKVVSLSKAGRYQDAAPLAEEALRLREAALGPDHLDVATSLNNLAFVYGNLGRTAAAELLYRRALSIREAALGANDPEVARSLVNLGECVRMLGRYSDAEGHYKRAITIFETALGAEHPDLGTGLNNLAELYRSLGRFSEAEPLQKRDLEMSEKALGANDPNVAMSLGNLAAIYRAQGRAAEAEPLYERSLEIIRASLGEQHPYFAIALNNLAETYRIEKRFDLAERLFRQSLALREKALGPEHPDVATALNNLASVHTQTGHYSEAATLYERSLTLREKALGREHPLVGSVLNNLAMLHGSQGSYGEAESNEKRALAIFEAALGPRHADVGTALGNLAWYSFAQKRWSDAADYWRRSSDIAALRTMRGLNSLGSPLASTADGETGLDRRSFWGLVKSLSRKLGEDAGADRIAAAQEAFVTAQWAQASAAATSLAQMGARQATADPALAPLIRARQDLVAEWQIKDKQLVASKSAAPARRNASAETALRERLDAIERLISEIDSRLAADFSDYMAFANPKPLEVDEVRAFLSDDEALVLFFDAPTIKPEPDETFVWVVTKTDLRWMRADLGPRELQELVAGLRCGLDASSWSGAGEKLCQSTLGSKYTSADSLAGKPLPYDPLRAFALYKALFGHLSDTIKNADGTGKHLLLVPFGALQTFPFQAALTDLPAGGAKPAWLMRRHAITVLPSVASLQALRAHPHSKIPGRKPYVAFANPVLLGRNTSEDKARATLAAAKKDCATVTSLAEIAKLREAFSSAKIEAPSLGSVADVSELRHLAPVPQTADLACAVAKALGASEDDIHLSARATEAAVKASSSSGALASYAVVNFATHGAIAGELTSSAEPGLVLTPPETASEQDDGYLSASEVAALKLNADWVVLAACNTAAGEVRGAEALSGLARAFFYAGARAILVSHWSVREDAAAVLVTDAIGADASNKPFGRAEALRRSMLALADSPDPVVAHPAYWAPFIVVGEGSTR